MLIWADWIELETLTGLPRKKLDPRTFILDMAYEREQDGDIFSSRHIPYTDKYEANERTWKSFHAYQQFDNKSPLKLFIWVYDFTARL